MRFWELNKWKVLRLWVLLSVACILFIYSLGKGKNDEHAVSIAIAIGMVISTFIMSMSVLGGVLSFKALKKLTEDESDLSVVYLFDNGYTITLKDTKSWFLFTKEQLTGTISGFPVNVSFEMGSKSSPSCFSFSFYALTKPGFGKKLMRQISFDVNFKKRLKRDVKPDVLAFIEQLKEKEYAVDTAPA